MQALVSLCENPDTRSRAACGGNAGKAPYKPKKALVILDGKGGAPPGKGKKGLTFMFDSKNKASFR